MTDQATAHQPFTILGIEPRPWIHPHDLETAFTERAAATHPDRVTDVIAKAEAVEISAQVTQAYQTLKKISSRLGLLLGNQSHATARIGAVPEPWGSLLIRVGDWAQRCDRWVAEQSGTLTFLEKALAAAEGQRLLEEMTPLRAEIDHLETELMSELKALDEAWPQSDLTRLASLRQRFAFSEKVHALLEERFLRLAEKLL